MQFRLAILTLLIVCASPVALLAAETKDVKFTLKNGTPVVFSHGVHLKKYNNNCRVCHNAIYNLGDKRRYSMAQMRGKKSCGACHTGVKAFSVADEKSCVRCHTAVPTSIKYSVKQGPAAFSHAAHLDRFDGKCNTCHNNTVIPGGRVSMAQMEKGKSCGACHNDKQAFTVAGNCGNCHKGLRPREVNFKVKGITDVTFSHNFHLQAYQCKSCHTKLFPYQAGVKHATMAEMGKGKSCGACHNGKEAFAAMGDCNKCHKGFKPGPITFKNEGGEVKFSHEFHTEAYKCADCHTKIFPYKAGVKKATMGDMDEGKSCGACHNGKDAFASSGDCGKCHKM